MSAILDSRIAASLCLAVLYVRHFHPNRQAKLPHFASS